MENIICYTIKEDIAKKIQNATEWLTFVTSLSDKRNNIHCVTFVNEGENDIYISGTTLKTGMYKALSTPTPGGNIDIKNVTVEFDGESILSVNIQRIHDLHYKQIEVK
jgi:hypothetical protein